MHSLQPQKVLLLNTYDPKDDKVFLLFIIYKPASCQLLGSWFSSVF